MTGRLRVAGQSAPSTEFWSQNRKDIKSEEEGEIKDVVREGRREGGTGGNQDEHCGNKIEHQLHSGVLSRSWLLLVWPVDQQVFQ